MKAEYLFNDVGTISGNSSNLTAFTPAIAFPANTFHHAASIRMHIVRAGINFHF
jgi:outer membrane immunogenic protein